MLALANDAFNGAVDPAAGWSPDSDHGVLARRFAERFPSDERLLVTLELHDEPYWLSRTRADAAMLDAALERIPDVALFVRFIELDASTEGKDVGDGRVLVSDDGVRVALEWRWRGETTARLLRDGEVVRQALQGDPVFVRAQAVDARLYREFTPIGGAS